jgi:uncharacterized membrane protein
VLGRRLGVFTSEPQLLAILFGAFGAAHFATGRLLRLAVQVGVGGLYWLGAVAIMLWPAGELTIFVILAALGELGFGLWLWRSAASARP